MSHSKHSIVTRLVLPLLAVVSVVSAGSIYAWQRYKSARQPAYVKLAQCIRQPPEPAASRIEETELWAKLAQGGQVLVIRHAQTTPGNSDPDNFDINHRSTQRNLSEEGQKQARAIGQSVLGHGLKIDEVYSSQFYRCRDTAELAFGKCEPMPLLNAFPEDQGRQAEQRVKMLDFIRHLNPQGITALVTHSTNIAAITSLPVAMGSAVVLKPNGSDDYVVEGVLKLSK